MRPIREFRAITAGIRLSTLHKVAMQGTPTSQKSGSNAAYRPTNFDGAMRWMEDERRLDIGPLPPRRGACRRTLELGDAYCEYRGFGLKPRI
jgi:hypothetical protein